MNRTPEERERIYALISDLRRQLGRAVREENEEEIIRLNDEIAKVAGQFDVQVGPFLDDA